MKHYAGVLMSVTSLPSHYGIGCFDEAAVRFVDYLADCGQKYWQILPLGVTSFGGSDDSPYQSHSAFAGNPYLISLDRLIEDGLLTRQECDALDFGSDPTKVDFEKLHENRLPLLHKAYERSSISIHSDYQDFCKRSAWWLDDYALFMAVKAFFGGVSFQRWPEDIRLHWGNAVDYYNRTLYFDVEFQKFLQYQFDRQWRTLKRYANSRHIEIVGDIPIYVSADGADVWAHPELFQLDSSNVPTATAGCPPDGFSADGQSWGNPLYRWDYHRQTGYEWWISRIWHSFQLYDVARIDHFRGFADYFSIPYGSDTAKDGHWEQGPGMDFFRAVEERLGKVHFIAEDLGVMTDAVRRLVADSGYPNMKVLQFAVNPEDFNGLNDYWPHNYNENCVVYTGTHDNETLAGWYMALDEESRQQLRLYLGNADTPDEKLYFALITRVMTSVARSCIIPIQDYLGLDNTARMNQPGTVGKNWRWRLSETLLTPELATEIRMLTMRSGRTNWEQCS